jgi:Holliday junction resolvase RusA-like endonuclease
MIVIEIPLKTLSVNHLYGFKGHFRFIKKEGREIRNFIQCHIIAQRIDVSEYINKKLKVEVDIYEDWMTKKGEIKRTDLSNREKFLVDSVFEVLKLDDKQIFEHTMRKIQSDKEKFIIKIMVVES